MENGEGGARVSKSKILADMAIPDLFRDLTFNLLGS